MNMVNHTQLNMTNIIVQTEHYGLSLYSQDQQSWGAEPHANISNMTEWLSMDNLFTLNFDFQIFQLYCKLFFQKLTFLYNSMLVSTDFVLPHIDEDHAHSFLFTVSAFDAWKVKLLIFLFEHSFIILMLSYVFILFKMREKPSPLDHALLQIQLLQDKIKHDGIKYAVRSQMINELSIKLAKEKMYTFVLKNGGKLDQVKGWKVVEITRFDGSKDDKYYFNTKGQRFRSLNEIAKHLKLVTVKDCVITRASSN